jgi:propionyl-CoA synthetase
MWSDLRQASECQVPCEPMQSTDISYTIYTSGTTSKPKVQRDTGGYAVALATNIKHIF